MIYNPFFIISMPLIFSCVLAYFLYDVDTTFYKNTFILFSVLVLLTLIMEKGLRLFKIRLQINSSEFIKDRSQSLCAIFFGFFIVLFCMIDLYLRGPILFTSPTSYYVFTPLEKYVRYICIMCWSLIPIAFFCTKNKIIKVTFITVAILFPILAVDRNRLLNSAYAFLVTFIIMNKEKLNKKYIYKNIKKICLFSILAFMCLVLTFSYIGNKRAGIEGIIAITPSLQKEQLLERKLKYKKYKNVSIENITPLIFNSTFIKHAPNSLAWIAIYASSSIFNFSTILNINYRDTDFLNYQLFRSFKSDIPKSPIDFTPLPTPISLLTVGTEFYPFLLYGGESLVAFSFLLLCAIYLSFLVFFSRFPSSIFLLLGFLKLTYCCIMLGFAPQFFTFTNIGFLILMVVMHKITQSQLTLECMEKVIKNRFTQKIATYKNLFISLKT